MDDKSCPIIWCSQQTDETGIRARINNRIHDLLCDAIMHPCLVSTAVKPNHHWCAGIVQYSHPMGCNYHEMDVSNCLSIYMPVCIYGICLFGSKTTLFKYYSVRVICYIYTFNSYMWSNTIVIVVNVFFYRCSFTCNREEWTIRQKKDSWKVRGMFIKWQIESVKTTFT